MTSSKHPFEKNLVSSISTDVQLKISQPSLRYSIKPIFLRFIVFFTVHLLKVSNGETEVPCVGVGRNFVFYLPFFFKVLRPECPFALLQQCISGYFLITSYFEGKHTTVVLNLEVPVLVVHHSEYAIPRGFE